LKTPVRQGRVHAGTAVVLWCSDEPVTALLHQAPF